MNENSISAIVLDLDDTVIPSSRFYGQAVEAVIGPSHYARETFAKARAEVKHSLPFGHVSARNRILYFKRFLELRGESPVAALNLYDRYEAALCALIRAWVQGTHRLDTLECFRRFGPIYILTNENTRTQLAKIDALCQNNFHFDGILTSEEAGCEKPDLAIFEHFCRRFSLRPELCLYVGDSVEHDIRPARKVGFRAIHTIEFTDSPQVAESCEYPTVNRLERALDFI